MNLKRLYFAPLVLALTVGVVAIGLLLVTTISLPRASAAPVPFPNERAAGRILADDPSPPSSPVKLIFIHHSCGGHWLADIGEHDMADGLG